MDSKQKEDAIKNCDMVYTYGGHCLHESDDGTKETCCWRPYVKEIEKIEFAKKHNIDIPINDDGKIHFVLLSARIAYFKKVS